MKGDGNQRVQVLSQLKSEDKKWLGSVSTQEHNRPLEVSRDFVLDYERREQENSERLSLQVEQHIHTLKTLRSKLEHRVDLKSRTDQYRDFQREFRNKKEAIFEGKTIEEYNKSKEILLEEPTTTTILKKKNGPTSDLSHVLNSLTRLTELENRISKLETNNIFDNLLEAEENPKVPETIYDIDFKKKRSAGIENKSNMKVMYSIQSGQNKKNNFNKDSLARGNGISAIRQQRDNNNNNNNGGTFLTGVQEENTYDDRK